MKNLLLLPLLLVTYFCLSQDAKAIIGKPITIGNLLVAQHDFPKEMNWDDAKKACSKLGAGWRLPSKDEWKLIYKNKSKIGGITHEYYWSSSEGVYEDAWVQNAFDGSEFDGNGGYPYSVRAVKSDPYSILTKILSYSNQNTFSGVSQVGYARGESYFDFSKLSRQFPNVLVTYTALNRKATEGGVLKNFRFSNSGKLNTNILYANWQNFEKDHAGSGIFELSVFDENEPNKVYIGISGNSWSYYINVQLTEQQFQEITNLLSISEKPKKTSLHNLSPMEDDHREISETPEPISPVSIIGKPIKIGNLLVAQYDFPKIMSWNDAIAACAKLGKGWRLPTKDELNSLYLSKDKIGGFAYGFYWSSTEVDANDAWLQGFNDGSQASGFKFLANYVRAIRTF